MSGLETKAEMVWTCAEEGLWTWTKDMELSWRKKIKRLERSFVSVKEGMQRVGVTGGWGTVREQQKVRF